MRGAAFGAQAAAWRNHAARRLAAELARRMAGLGYRLRRSAQITVARLTDQWRRSLQLRVITVTFVVSGLVVVVLGFVLMQQIAQNIIASKEKAADNIASVGLSVAQTWPGVGLAPTSSSHQMMAAIVSKLQTTGSSSGTDYAVMVMLPSRYQGNPVYSGGANDGFSSAVPTPPASLVQKVLQHHNG